jgi:hypothetical protein
VSYSAYGAIYLGGPTSFGLALAAFHGFHPWRGRGFSPMPFIAVLFDDSARCLPNRSIKKYLSTKRPSRALSGPPQFRRLISRSIVGPSGASTRTTLYNAPQSGQLKSMGGPPGILGSYQIDPMRLNDSFETTDDKASSWSIEAFAM